MTQPANSLSENFAPVPRLLPVLVVLFVGSGCSALIYEIVWLQMLQLVIGSSAVSLGVLLGTFMGGMCLGSLALPRLVSSRRHPLRVYAVLEAAIGCMGLILVFIMPSVFNLYAGNGLTGLPGILLRGLVAALCLLPPTILMGATLPAIARWVRSTPEGISWLGFFYAGNIVGAVCGCFLTAFYLLRIYDVTIATYVAVAMNLAVAGVSLALAAKVPHIEPLAKSLPAAPQLSNIAAANEAIYFAIALSGATALGAEVLWTRLLSLMLGTTVYTFAIILAMFLVGLGLGSSLGAFVARHSARPRLALGVCQLMLTAAIAWAAFMVAHSLPYWPIDSSLVESFWDGVPLDIGRCICVTLPATILWGASFPLALASVAGNDQDTGRLVGRVYAANTLGAIVGAVGTAVFLIGSIGTQQSQRLLIGLSTVAAMLVLVPMLQKSTTGTPVRGRFALAVSTLAALFLVWSVDMIPARLIAYGHYPSTNFLTQEIIFSGEGFNASIAISERDDGTRAYHSSGRTEAGNDPSNLRVQRMLSHIPALIHPKPKSVLIVGCGTGITAGAFVIHPDIERIVICDFEPLVPRVVPSYFTEDNYDVINDPRVEIINDDARHYLLSTQDRFDVITSDPFEPIVKGVAVLYTAEHFELIKRHLNPGGVVTQYVPVYESSTDTVRTGFATFFTAFPQGTVWINDHDGFLPDVVLMGQPEPAPIDLNALNQRWNREDHAEIVQSLAEVGFNSPIDLLTTYGGGADNLKPWLESAEINRDRNLRLQYLAGFYSKDGDETNVQMLSYWQFPESLFVATPKDQEALRKAFEENSRLTTEEMELFEAAIAEIEQFGSDRYAKALVQEVDDVYSNGSVQEKREWLREYALPAITREEQEKFDAYVKELKTKEDQDEGRKTWAENSTAGKRYLLKYFGTTKVRPNRVGALPLRAVPGFSEPVRLMLAPRLLVACCL